MTKHFTFMESESVTVETEQLFESAFVKELTGKKWKVRIIKGDTQGSSAYYPTQLLESNPNVVKQGTRIFLDHITDGERPERSVQKLAGVFATDSYYENGDLWADVEIFSDYREWVKERATTGVIGLSIHGTGQKMEENGRIVAKTIDAIHSVDIVTRAGAGGGFAEMIESDSNPTQKEENMELPKELLEALDNQANAITELVEAQKTQAQKFEELLEAQTEQEKELEESKTPKLTAADVSEALVESGLTKAGRKAVYAAVEAGTDLEEAITAEKERENEILSESNARFGMGNQGDNGSGEKVEPASLIFG